MALARPRNRERKTAEPPTDNEVGAASGMRLFRHQAAPFPYAIGEVYLAALPDLREVEIEDVVPAVPAVKIRGGGWMDGAAFAEVVRARLGRVVYSGGLLGNRRKVVREVPGAEHPGTPGTAILQG